MNKILFLPIIIFLLSCGPDQKFRFEKDLNNQKEIDFIKKHCQKYNNPNQLSICVKKSKKSFHCLTSVDSYLEKMYLQAKIECRKESHRQFSYSQSEPEEKEEKSTLREEDIKIIYDNIDHFLQTNEIIIPRYEQKKKENKGGKSGSSNSYKNRSSIYYSRTKFVEKCQENFNERKDVVSERYLERCHKILQEPLKN